MNVLFVCLGNICRSPLAAGIMRKLYEEQGLHGLVDSAGCEDWHQGEPADLRSIRVASENGIDLTSHRGRQVRPADFFLYDVIYAMDSEIGGALRRLAPPSHVHKIHPIDTLDVLDPYEGDLTDFRMVYAQLARACARVAGDLVPGIALEPLSNATLERALALLNRVFPRKGTVLHHPALALRLSLAPRAPLSRAAFRFAGVIEPRYWVAIEKASGAVVGVTGRYETRADREEAAWGGWTCVDPRYQGRGLGVALFSYVIDSARREGKTYMRAYSSTDARERKAQRLYELLGMPVVREERYFLGKERKQYREAILA